MQHLAYTCLMVHDFQFFFFTIYINNGSAISSRKKKGINSSDKNKNSN